LLPLEYHYPELTAAQRHKRILTICKQMDIHQSILDERPALLHPQMYKMALLARAFVLEPKIILYDNPLLDLEMKYKKIVYNHILHLREHLSVTQIFISTSDILFEITDTNLVFNRGAIVESGTWDELILSEQTATQNIIREYLETGLNPG
jgi:microcin C transport system ATP-binding protein